MTKLWKVTVNNLGWDRPKTFYARSQEEAKVIEARYPASDGVEYAGNFTDRNAACVLYDCDERKLQYGCDYCDHRYVCPIPGKLEEDNV